MGIIKLIHGLFNHDDLSIQISKRCWGIIIYLMNTAAHPYFALFRPLFPAFLVLNKNTPKISIKEMFPEATKQVYLTKDMNVSLEYTSKDVQRMVKLGEALYAKGDAKMEKISAKAALWDKLATTLLKKGNDLSAIKKTDVDNDKEDVGVER